MIKRDDPQPKRIAYFLVFLVLSTLFSVLMSALEVHYIVSGMIIISLAAFLGYRSSERSGYMYLYFVAGFTALFMATPFLNDLILASRGNASIDRLRQIQHTDAAIISFSNAHVEKEKYGHYVYNYRGHWTYFAAPLVDEGWSKSDTVYAFAVFEAESPYQKLVFEDPNVTLLQDSLVVMENDSIASVPAETDNNASSDAIYYDGWNTNINKALRVNDDISRYRDAVKRSTFNHKLLVSSDPAILYWMDNPQEELKSQKDIGLYMTLFFLVVIVIWLIVLENKISRSKKTA